MTISYQKKRSIIEKLILKKTYREIAKNLKVSNTTIQNCNKELENDYNRFSINKDTIKISYIAEMLFTNENRSKRFGNYENVALECIKEIERIRNDLIEIRKIKKD